MPTPHLSLCSVEDLRGFRTQVSVDSCPVNCIHWVDAEELPLLEFLVRPQPRKAYGVFGGGWERPADVFAAAKSLKKQLKEQEEKKHNRDHKGTNSSF